MRSGSSTVLGSSLLKSYQPPSQPPPDGLRRAEEGELLVVALAGSCLSGLSGSDSLCSAKIFLCVVLCCAAVLC